MSEMFKPKQFDSFKKVPKNQKENFKKEKDGSFVYKEAAQELSDAEAIAEIANILKEQGITSLDVLHERANNMQNKGVEELSEEFTEEKKSKLKYIEGERDFYQFSQYDIENYIHGLPKELQEDEDILAAIAKKKAAVYYCLPEKLKKSNKIILGAIKSNFFTYKEIPNELQENKDFALEAMKIDKKVFQCFPKELRDDDDIALSAVEHDGKLLEFASERLKNNKDIVRAAIKNDADAFDYVSKELKKNEDYMLDLVEEGAEKIVVHYDKDFALKAIEKNPNVLMYAPKHFGLQNDRDIVLAAAKREPILFRYASKELHDDPKTVLEVIKGFDNELQEKIKKSPKRMLEHLNVSQEILDEIEKLLSEA